MNQNLGRRLRATAGLLAGAVGAASLTLVLAHLTAAGVPRGGAVRVEDLVALLVTGAGTAVGAWLAVSTGIALLCVLTRMAGSSWRAGEATVHRLAPAIVRRALAVTVTTGLGLSLATGAHAAASAPVPASVTTVASTAVSTAADDDLGWSPTSGPVAPPDLTWHPTGTVTTDPATVTVSSVPTVAAPAPAAAPEASRPAVPADAVTPAETVVVQEGDSLWDIAARHVAPGATDADIAAAWPRWFEANHDVIGNDPDVLHPGQHLRSPATAAPAPAGATTPDSPTPAHTEVTR